MPSIAQQLRSERHRRTRLRQVVVGGLVAVFAAAVGSRFLAEGRAGVASATAADLAIAATMPSITTTSVATTTTVASGLHPGLVDAFERAQASAADAGHDLTITSGFRSAAKQQALLNAEVDKRGSVDEALWWVFTPETSMHVHGLAIDVGDRPAAEWLEDHGDRYGLCHTLAWEWWHFEWRERWESSGACPSEAQTPAEAPGP